MNELEEKWSDVYLLRNEKAVRIYNFEDGKAFEPDFIMFANDKKTGNTSWQIFIEPKGEQFIDGEDGFDKGKGGWKQQFLNEITKRSEAKVILFFQFTSLQSESKTLVDDERYRIIGLPFYNDKLTKKDVEEKLRGL